MLSGGIVNSGTIAGKLGIGVFTTTVAGGIVDSGSIKATEAGISIDGLSEVLASKTAIDIAGPTFTGGISNFGVISGSAGIEIKSARAVSIFDGGTIIGTGGTAIEFAGSGNTLTLGAGYFISGIVDPQSGNNTFQLGGFGSDTFDLSSIGAAAQYQGFTIFNVVGGTWTVSSASTAHWTIKAGTLEITSGGSLTSTTVSSGGVLAIDSGATVSGVTIKTGATLELFGGIPLPSGVTIPAGATLGVGGGVYSGLIVSSGHTLKVLSGGTDLDATVRSGGALIVGSDGTDSGATILKGGVEKVTFGGASIDVALKSGGTEIVSAGGVASDTNVSSGGALVVSSAARPIRALSSAAAARPSAPAAPTSARKSLGAGSSSSAVERPSAARSQAAAQRSSVAMASTPARRFSGAASSSSEAVAAPSISPLPAAARRSTPLAPTSTLWSARRIPERWSIPARSTCATAAH